MISYCVPNPTNRFIVVALADKLRHAARGELRLRLPSRVGDDPAGGGVDATGGVTPGEMPASSGADVTDARGEADRMG